MLEEASHCAQMESLCKESRTTRQSRGDASSGAGLIAELPDGEAPEKRESPQYSPCLGEDGLMTGQG